MFKIIKSWNALENVAEINDCMRGKEKLSKYSETNTNSMTLFIFEHIAKNSLPKLMQEYPHSWSHKQSLSLLHRPSPGWHGFLHGLPTFAASVIFLVLHCCPAIAAKQMIVLTNAHSGLLSFAIMLEQIKSSNTFWGKNWTNVKTGFVFFQWWNCD